MRVLTVVGTMAALVAFGTTGCAPTKCGVSSGGHTVCWSYPDRQLTPDELEYRWRQRQQAARQMRLEGQCGQRQGLANLWNAGTDKVTTCNILADQCRCETYIRPKPSRPKSQPKPTYNCMPNGYGGFRCN